MKFTNFKKKDLIDLNFKKDKEEPATHVQMETPGCCCRGCCSCSTRGLGQESSDFGQEGRPEPEGCRSGSPLQKKQEFVKTGRESASQKQPSLAMLGDKRTRNVSVLCLVS